MSNIKTIFLVILVMALAGYAVHMNMRLNSIVDRYETSATEMVNRFEKVNEDALKAREELARQIVASEKAGAAVEMAKAEVAKAISEIKQDIPEPAEKISTEPVIAAKKRQPISGSGAREKAEKARAEAEALLSEMSDKPNAWEEHTAHL